MSKSHSHQCPYDPSDMQGTLKRYSRLSEAETCPHIRKAQPTVGNVELFAVMDSNCFEVQSDSGNVCNKNESSVLRLIAKKEILNRNMKRQAVTCVLRSLRPDLLSFVDGHMEDPFSILDLKELNKPMWIVPIYQKNGKVNWADTSVTVKRIRKTN